MGDRADFVGIQDFYDTSLCMLLYRLTGHWRDGCKCVGGSHELEEVKVTHHVPPHQDVFPDDMLRLMDGMAKLDKPFYEYGLLRFFCDVRSFEAAYGINLLCQEKLTSVSRRIHYLFDGGLS